MTLRWRVALIDSGPVHAPNGTVRFTRRGVGPQTPVDDPTGHGSRIASLLAEYAPPHDLLCAQVFDDTAATSVAAIVAALDWACEQGVHLVHLSLGLVDDRASLAGAVARAQAAGCLLVAAAPARGAPVYPAAYSGILVGTGDARCAPDEVSRLGECRFGGCVEYRSPGHGRGRGASVGAAFVTAAVLAHAQPGTNADAVERTLASRSRYDGAERRTARPREENAP